MGVKKPIEALHQQRSITYYDALMAANKKCDDIIIDSDSDFFSDMDSIDESMLEEEHYESSAVNPHAN